MSEQHIPPWVPCRLFGLLARDAPRAVILRRGPTQRVQQVLWHTDTDIFEYGQWFYGRIYEWGCDLSPDGTLFLYLARKTKTLERERSRTTHKWTALSRPPYFTALALWPAGESWQGGGMFLSNYALWLCYARSGIESDPNMYGDEGYILRLVGQVVTVSVETVKLVGELERGVKVEEWVV